MTQNGLYFLALLFSVILGVCSQLLLKAGAVRITSVVTMLFQPYIFFGLFGYFVSAMFYIYALRTIKISTAYPIMSITYVVVPVLAYLIWHEPFNAGKVVALTLITVGVALMCLTSV